MRFKIITTLVLSTLVLSGCEKTNVQFGQSNETPVMHDDLGNVRENMKLEPLAPISDSSHTQENIAPAVKAAPKVAKPKVLIPKVNTNEIASTEPASNVPTTALAPATPAPATALAAPATAAVKNDWQPNEALLIRSNELLFGLQKELGKKPTVAEMQKRLQSHMGLTATQAQVVIAALGLV